MNRPIAVMGDPILKQMAREVTREELPTDFIQNLIDDMLATLKASKTGVGLAAPQISQSLRIVLVADPMTVLVNPEVTVLDQSTIDDWEGCLSIPDFRGRVPRWRKLRVDALDRKGNKIQITAEGFFARVIQHEFDHLMGKVYLDRMPDLKTLCHLAEFQRYWLPAEKDDE